MALELGSLRFIPINILALTEVIALISTPALTRLPALLPAIVFSTDHLLPLRAKKYPLIATLTNKYRRRRSPDNINSGNQLETLMITRLLPPQQHHHQAFKLGRPLRITKMRDPLEDIDIQVAIILLILLRLLIRLYSGLLTGC